MELVLFHQTEAISTLWTGLESSTMALHLLTTTIPCRTTIYHHPFLTNTKEQQDHEHKESMSHYPVPNELHHQSPLGLQVPTNIIADVMKEWNPASVHVPPSVLMIYYPWSSWPLHDLWHGLITHCIWWCFWARPSILVICCKDYVAVLDTLLGFASSHAFHIWYYCWTGKCEPYCFSHFEMGSKERGGLYSGMIISHSAWWCFPMLWWSLIIVSNCTTAFMAFQQ